MGNGQIAFEVRDAHLAQIAAPDKRQSLGVRDERGVLAGVRN